MSYLGGGGKSAQTGGGADVNACARHPRSSKKKALATMPKKGRKPGAGAKQWTYQKLNMANPPADIQGL